MTDVNAGPATGTATIAGSTATTTACEPSWRDSLTVRGIAAAGAGEAAGCDPACPEPACDPAIGSRDGAVGDALEDPECAWSDPVAGAGDGVAESLDEPECAWSDPAAGSGGGTDALADPECA